jgi:hypothetical protein
MHATTTRWLAPLFILGIAMAATGALAHPRHDHAGHDHGKPEEARKPTQEQIDKRLERVQKRAEARKGNRKQRQSDRRRALRKRLYHRLRGAPITPEVKQELVLHAKRTAELRRIRYVAALEKDYDSVVAADKALARENARHEAWWRSVQRKADEKAGAGGKDAKP